MSNSLYDDTGRRQAPSRLLPPLRSNLPVAADPLPSAAVLPEQFYAPVMTLASSHGVLALMHAVLDDALSCWQKQFTTNRRRERRVAHEAERWFFSNNSSWPFAFVNICAALGLDPNYIRQGLRRWRHSPPPRVSRVTGHAVVKQRRLKCAA